MTPNCPFCGGLVEVLTTTIFGVKEPIPYGWECVSEGHWGFKDDDVVGYAPRPARLTDADPGPVRMKKIYLANPDGVVEIPDTEPDYESLYEDALTEIDLICGDLRSFARRFDKFLEEFNVLRKRAEDRLARLDGTSV